MAGYRTRMRKVLALAAVLMGLLASGTAVADEPRTAADVTEPGRSFARALDVVFAAPLSSDQGERHIVIVIDPGSTLAGAGFTDALDAALARNSRYLARTAFTVLNAGGNGKPAVKRSKDAAEISRAVAGILAKPTSTFANVCAAVRRASELAGRATDKVVLLVTLDNNDVEDDVEGTAKALSKRKAVLHAITKESFLSDTYWHSYSSLAKPPRPMTMAVGGDVGFAQIPWGWLFQQTLVHELAPSGFATYGISRMAAQSKGKVFLYSPPAGKHVCAVQGTCLFCSGDHAPATQRFQVHRVKALAPLVESRSRALSALGSDPYYRLVLRTWTRASKMGLLRSKPSVRGAGKGLKPEKRMNGAYAPVAAGLNLKRNIAKAKRLAIECGALAKEHAASLKSLGEKGGTERTRAIADYVLAMLHLTEFNLYSYMRWCAGTGPWLLEYDGPDATSPLEMAPFSADRQPVGIHWNSWCLCHGVAPFKHIKFGQDADLNARLDTLNARLEPYFKRWAHTPFEIALRQAGIARFYVTFRGTGTVTQPDRKGSDSDKETTETGRPSRNSGPGSSGGSTGPVTGGG